jgi:hypothetical protein
VKVARRKLKWCEVGLLSNSADAFLLVTYSGGGMQDQDHERGEGHALGMDFCT